MTAQSDPYVRVYYRIIDDPKFEKVYDNDRLLAGWLRLLLAADAMYPAPAQLPRGIRRDVLATLASVDLIELLNGDRFRLIGLKGERERRSEQARKAAQSRYEKAAAAVREQPMSSAGAVDTHLHSEPNRTEPIRTAPLRHGATGLTPIGDTIGAIGRKLA